MFKEISTIQAPLNKKNIEFKTHCFFKRFPVKMTKQPPFKRLLPMFFEMNTVVVPVKWKIFKLTLPRRSSSFDREFFVFVSL